jgi:hypothetical protein
LSVALLRAVINMQIVAVNQFVLIPQSTVYEAIVVTGLSFFTLCVLCISAWQADAIVPAICSARPLQHRVWSALVLHSRLYAPTTTSFSSRKRA